MIKRLIILALIFLIIGIGFSLNETNSTNLNDSSFNATLNSTISNVDNQTDEETSLNLTNQTDINENNETVNETLPTTTVNETNATIETNTTTTTVNETTTTVNETTTIPTTTINETTLPAGIQVDIEDNKTEMSTNQFSTLSVEISSCRTLSTANEVYILTSDIIDKDGTCFTIGANNITLDCRGHVIDGDGDSNGYGIYINGARNGFTLRNCTVKEFQRNLYVAAGTRNLRIENSQLIDAYYDGMLSYGITNVYIINSIFSSLNEYGAYIWYSGSHYNYNWTVINTTFIGGTTNSDYGARIRYMYNSTFENDTFLGGTGNRYGYGVYIDYSENLTFRGCYMEGRSTERSRAFYAAYNSKIHIINSTIISPGTSGYEAFQLYDTDDSYIYGNYFECKDNYAFGISYYSTNNVVENNVFNSRNGIYIQTYSNNNRIFNNIINSSAAYGIYINNYCNDNEIINNSILVPSYGIYARSYASGNYFINNTIISTGNYAVYLNDHSGSNLFYNNHIETQSTSTSYYGIRAYLSCGGNNITKNTIIAHGTALRLEYTSNSNYVDSNIINSTGSVGIHVTSQTADNNVFKNNIIHAYTHAIDVDAINTNTKIINNTLISQNGWGCYVATGTNVLIANNTIISGTSNDNGLGLYTVTGGVVYNNLVNATANGIVLDGGGVINVTVRNNTIHASLGGGNYNGIYVTGNSTENLIEDNYINSHDYIGVYVDDSDANTFINNYVTSGSYSSWYYDYGIYIQYSDYNVFINNTINNTGGPGVRMAYCNNNTFIGNLFMNNYVGVYLTYSKMRKTDFANNVILNTSSPYDYRLESSDASPSKIYFLNCTYNDAAVYWNSYSSVERVWYLRVNVTDPDGPVSNATILVYDRFGSLVANETTDENGLSPFIPLTEYLGVYKSSTTMRKTYYSNYTIQVSAVEHFDNSGEVNMSGNKFTYITLEYWPDIKILADYPRAGDYHAFDTIRIRVNETRRPELIDKVNVTIRFADDVSKVFSMTNGINGDTNLWEYNYTIDPTDRGGPLVIIAMAYNSTGYNYDNDTKAGLIIKPKIVWLKTYDFENRTKSFFGQNETVRIKASVYNPYENYPRIEIKNSAGSTVSNGEMINEEGTIYRFDYVANTIPGYFDVVLHANENISEEFPYEFYEGRNWRDKFTDYDGRIFVYVNKIVVSEPNVLERRFYPVDVRMNFTELSDPTSIRVTSFNGSTYFEIPSQVYNYTLENGSIRSANVVWLVSLDKNGSRTYYIHYNDISNGNATYDTDLNTYITTSNYRFFNNSYYTVRVDSDNGGMIDAVWPRYGGEYNIVGQDPMQTSPSIFTITSEYYAAHKDVDPSVDLVYSGPVFNEYTVESYLSASGGTHNTDLPFEQIYWTYSKNGYIIYQTRLEFNQSYNLENLIDYFIYYGDGYFNKVAWQYPNGTVIVHDLASGNGPDYMNIDPNITWIGVYNDEDGTAIGDIFLARTNSVESDPKIDFYDQTGYEFYKRYIISSPSLVDNGSSFITKIARIIWDGRKGWSVLNETYTSLMNPLNYSVDSIEYGDTNKPFYFSYNVTPTNPRDDQNVLCYSYWGDDLRLKEGIVETNATGIPVNHTIKIHGNESWINYTIPYSDLRGSRIYCKFYAKDIGNNINSTPMVVFNVTDVLPPVIEDVRNYPNTTDDLDPGVVVNVTAKVIDKIKLATVVLQYRYENGTWNETVMNGVGNDTFVANFSASDAGNYVYRINASDTSGNWILSNETVLRITFDMTWKAHVKKSETGGGSQPSTEFEVVSGIIGTKIFVTNITINNTADYPANFSFKSTRSSWIYYDGNLEPYTVSLGPKNVTTVNVTAQLPVDIGEYPVQITVENLNSSADPSSITISGYIVAYQSGPYLWAEFTEYRASALSGDSNINYTVKIKNLGNETATNVTSRIIVPSNWTVTGNLTKTFDLIDPNDFVYHSILVSIPKNTASGTYTIKAVPTANNTNQTHDAVLSIDVVNPVIISNQTEQETTGGGGGGGTSGSGGTGLTFEQLQKLFQTNATYEIVRGKQMNFTLKVENPFDKKLEHVCVNVTGFLSQYLRIDPHCVAEIPVNESSLFTIWVEAPSYFTQGTYYLNFTITGIVNETKTINNVTIRRVTNMKESRSVTLIVLEIPTSEAKRLLNESWLAIMEMNRSGIKTRDVMDLYGTALERFNEKDYKTLIEICNTIKEKKEQAFKTLSLIKEIEERIKEAEHNGLKVPKTGRLLLLAKAALEREDFSTALKRAEDSKVTYALETVGKFNVFAYVRNNWEKVSGFTIISIIISYLLILYIRLNLINMELRRLRKEEKVVLGLIKEVQRECFEEGKMSMEEYTEALMHYERRLSDIVKRAIELGTKREHLFRLFKKEKDRLLAERKKLLNLMKETQKLYLEKGKIETRIYQNKMRSFAERLAEIDERLATLDVKEELKKVGIRWRIK